MLIAEPRLMERPSQDCGGNGVPGLLDEALPQRLIGGEPMFPAAERLLEFGDRVIEQTHFFVRDAKIVMRLEVVFPDDSRDALLEVPKEGFEVGLLVAADLGLRHAHPRSHWRVVSQPLRQVDVLVVWGGLGRRRRCCRAKCGACPLVPWINLEHARVDRVRTHLVTRPHESIGEVEVGHAQTLRVIETNGQLDPLLVIRNAVRAGVDEFVRNVAGHPQMAGLRKTGQRCLQFGQPALALADFEKRLGQSSPHDPIMRSPCYRRAEFVAPGRRDHVRIGRDCGERERRRGADGAKRWRCLLVVDRADIRGGDER